MNFFLNKNWVLAREVQHEDILIFESRNSKVNQNNYKYIFTDDNKFIENSVSNGHLNTKTGHYKFEGNSLNINFENSYYDSKFDIVYHDDKILKLKRVY